MLNNNKLHVKLFIPKFFKKLNYFNIFFIKLGLY